MKEAMSQRLTNKIKHKKGFNLGWWLDQFWGAVLVAGFLYCIWVLFQYNEMRHEPEIIRPEHVGFIDMWRYESSPSDRRAMLDGLNATDCIAARLCELTYDLPVAGL